MMAMKHDKDYNKSSKYDDDHYKNKDAKDKLKEKVKDKVKEKTHQDKDYKGYKDKSYKDKSYKDKSYKYGKDYHHHHHDPMGYGGRYYGGMYYGGDEGFGYEYHDKTHDKIPPVQFGETDHHWIARVELPGVNKENVEIRVKNNKVIIFGKQTKKLFFEEKVQDITRVKWVKRERHANKFKRKLYLPVDLDEKLVHAKLNDGLLEVLIEKPKRHTIHTKDLTTDISEHRRIDLSESGTHHHHHDSATCKIQGCSMCTHPEMFTKPATVVIEHVHDKQIHERHIPRIEAVEHHQEIHKHVTPVERVEVHKHVHPHERVEVVEHVHPRERLDIHEHVRPVITTEIHEHVHPEVTREIHKDIYPPEITKVAHRDVDLGEVERKVVEKDLGKIDLGVKKVERVVEEISGTTTTTEHHHHHHHGGVAPFASAEKEKIKIDEKEHHHHGQHHHTTEKHQPSVPIVAPAGEMGRTTTVTTVTTEKTQGDHVIGGHHVDVMGKKNDFEYKKEPGNRDVTRDSKEHGVKQSAVDDKERERQRMDNLKRKEGTS